MDNYLFALWCVPRAESVVCLEQPQLTIPSQLYPKLYFPAICNADADHILKKPHFQSFVSFLLSCLRQGRFVRPGLIDRIQNFLSEDMLKAIYLSLFTAIKLYFWSAHGLCRLFNKATTILTPRQLVPKL